MGENAPWVFKRQALCFPGGTGVRNQPASEGGRGSIPTLGRSPVPSGGYTHAPRLSSLRAGAQKPQRLGSHAQLLKSGALEPVLGRERRGGNERPAHHHQIGGPARRTERKPEGSREDPAQRGVSKRITITCSYVKKERSTKGCQDWSSQPLLLDVSYSILLLERHIPVIKEQTTTQFPSTTWSTAFLLCFSSCFLFNF